VFPERALIRASSAESKHASRRSIIKCCHRTHQRV
jgi:hypothetical protein